MRELYYLDSDDDGHWYVVPVSKSQAFNKWLESVGDDDFDPDGCPEGVERVGGAPSRVVFTGYEIR